MADVDGRKFGTEVGGEPSCDPGGLDAAVGAVDTENDSLHRCTSPSSSQPARRVATGSPHGSKLDHASTSAALLEI